MLIDEKAIPHSHPVLTLHCRHNDEPLHLLSTYIHEQLHWFFIALPDEKVLAALEIMRRLYPHDMPANRVGAEQQLRTYQHYVICWLEWASMARLVGSEVANDVIKWFKADHYTHFYAAVLNDGDKLEDVIDACDIRPSPLLYKR